MDGFFLLENMYFLLQAKGLNDNGYLLIKVTNLTTNQIEHLVKLNI
jgi:hypothetical protein